MIIQKSRVIRDNPKRDTTFLLLSVGEREPSLLKVWASSGNFGAGPATLILRIYYDRLDESFVYRPMARLLTAATNEKRDNKIAYRQKR